jgi:hypothetical protein
MAAAGMAVGVGMAGVGMVGVGTVTGAAPGGTIAGGGHTASEFAADEFRLAAYERHSEAHLGFGKEETNEKAYLFALSLRHTGGGAELLLRPNAIPTRLRRRDKLRPHPRHGNGHSAAEKYGGNRQRNPRVARAAALQHRLARPMGGETSILNNIFPAAIALGLWANAVIMAIRPARADDGSYSYLGEIAQTASIISWLQTTRAK